MKTHRKDEKSKIFMLWSWLVSHGGDNTKIINELLLNMESEMVEIE